MPPTSGTCCRPRGMRLLLSRASTSSSWMLALERSMELIGEAARRVSSSFREKHPEIPWKEMIGLRNIRAHEYGRVDHAQLHATAIKDVPALIAALEKLLPLEK